MDLWLVVDAGGWVQCCSHNLDVPPKKRPPPQAAAVLTVGDFQSRPEHNFAESTSTSSKAACTDVNSACPRNSLDRNQSVVDSHQPRNLPPLFHIADLLPSDHADSNLDAFLMRPRTNHPSIGPAAILENVPMSVSLFKRCSPHFQDKIDSSFASKNADAVLDCSFMLFWLSSSYALVTIHSTTNATFNCYEQSLVDIIPRLPRHMDGFSTGSPKPSPLFDSFALLMLSRDYEIVHSYPSTTAHPSPGRRLGRILDLIHQEDLGPFLIDMFTLSLQQHHCKRATGILRVMQPINGPLWTRFTVFIFNNLIIMLTAPVNPDHEVDPCYSYHVEPSQLASVDTIKYTLPVPLQSVLALTGRIASGSIALQDSAVSFAHPNAEPIRQLSQISAELQSGMTETSRSLDPSTGSGDADQPCETSEQGLSYIPNAKRKAVVPPKCTSCGITDSPEWRRGPSGGRELCNACGLRFARQQAKLGVIIPRKRKKAKHNIDSVTSAGPDSATSTGANPMQHDDYMHHHPPATSYYAEHPPPSAHPYMFPASNSALSYPPPPPSRGYMAYPFLPEQHHGHPSTTNVAGSPHEHDTPQSCKEDSGMPRFSSDHPRPSYPFSSRDPAQPSPYTLIIPHPHNPQASHSQSEPSYPILPPHSSLLLHQQDSMSPLQPDGSDAPPS